MSNQKFLHFTLFAFLAFIARLFLLFVQALVIPELQTIEILTIEDGKYSVFSSAECEGVVQSKVINGFQIDIQNIFNE
ncbi:MAG: hypothetical protein L3V56_14715 [Candidatus Magnetoovum sp. WYHC-5]|nr:hypothetical protein [Candidatus Magnetoovum sp. WYHC-5]